MERWLHQHIFKVGWLLTRNFQTTTIFYYTFFLPGVLIHELVYWLVAGILNVRAERAIRMPEKQEIGELKLNFVQLERRTGTFRKAIISTAPLLVGLVLIWLIARNAFQLDAAFATMQSGDLEDVARSINQITGVPDFWLWLYIIFTIGNTMFPFDTRALQGWRTVLLSGAVLIVALLIVGVGGQIFSAVAEPLSVVLGVLEGLFLSLIIINFFVTLVLGTLEAIIERITGYSATFRKGRMITMTRAEAEEARRKAQEQQAKSRQRAAVKRPSTIYAFPLPVPGPPGEEAVTQPVGAVLGLSDKQSTLPGMDLEDDDEIEMPIRETPAGPRLNMPGRIGTPSTEAFTDYEEGTDDTYEQAFSPLAETVTTDDEEEELIYSSSEAFSEVSYGEENSEEDKTEEPTSASVFPSMVPSSPFGKSPLAPVTEDGEDEDEDEEESSIFSVSPFTQKNSAFSSIHAAETDDDNDENAESEDTEFPSVRASMSPFSSARPTITHHSDNDDNEQNEEENLQSPTLRSPFGSFSNTPQKPIDKEHQHPDDRSRQANNPVFSFTRSNDEEEEDEDEEVINRSSRGTDGVTSLFNALRYQEDYEDEGDEDELTYEDIDDYPNYDDDE